MIEKMKFINIMGNVDDIERVNEMYVSRYDIQIEDAVKELSNSSYIQPFISVNPYGDVLKQAERFASLVSVSANDGEDISKDKAYDIIEMLTAIEVDRLAKVQELEERKRVQLELLAQIKPFVALDFQIQSLLSFQYIKFRFGKIPASNYKQLEAYLSTQSDILFVEGAKGSDYIWGVYFVPIPLKEKIDAVFSSLHFERIYISSDLVGTPQEAFTSVSYAIDNIDEEIDIVLSKQSEAINEHSFDIACAYKKFKELYNYFDMQKFAGKTKDSFYILVGWMSESDAQALGRELEDDDKVVFIPEDDFTNVHSKPPTKLKNNFLVKPFEFFVKMYGFPAYNELDPTLFVAITYSLLFGMMFGDVGQGLLLSFLGFFLFKFRGVQLGSILTIVGLVSSAFGFVYGSVFGFEVLSPLWLRPLENINSVLITTVVFGVMLVIISMVFHIVNAFKAHDLGSALFDSNGVSGLIFYLTIIAAAWLAFSGRGLIAGWLLGFFIGVPLLLITFRVPLSNFVMKKTRLIKGRFGEFLLEAFFEMFEILLSYLTNSISFVRVGGFALSHAGMMSVVMLLAGAESNSTNVLVIIFGNILVMGMEGLIVGIQVLRLEYYEMFSRFFKGGGREFIPFNKTHN